MPKRGDRAAPPPAPDGWDVRFASGEAAAGWEQLCGAAAGNMRRAWLDISSDARPVVQTPRHHRLKYDVATASYKGVEMRQWQYEVTAGGRIWYLVDEERRIAWITLASVGHPKATD
jgi:hypothetical protein